MSEPDPKFAAQIDSDSRRSPVRVAFVTRRTSAHVKARGESTVMTLPEVIFRTAVAVELLAITLTLVSLVWQAPLEQLADPMHTPNPAKAPWYFLGLQELLHYFPPFVAGVLIPTLVVLALIAMPYFQINLEAKGFWLRDRAARRRLLSIFLVVFSVVMAGFQVWAVLVPTLLIAGAMLRAARCAPDSPSRAERWLVSKPLAYWIMTWFLVQTIVLTMIGTFFRGPGWSWVWPWKS